VNEGAAIQAHYELKIEGVGELLKGSIGADGVIDVDVPPRATRAHLLVLADADESVIEDFELAMGGLDPVTEPSGAAGRLRRLGFDPGSDEDGEWPQLGPALRSFQARYGLEVTGESTKETQEKLLALAGA
jgi:hypothetical protein